MLNSNMTYLLLAALIRLLGVAAQDSALNASEVLTLQLPPNECANIVLDRGVPERVSYSILPLTLTSTCGLPLQLSLPQDTKHLAWAGYNVNTTCTEVREPTVQPRSYAQEIKLDFVDVDNPSAWGLIYHSCTDTTWLFGHMLLWNGTETVGPLATTVFVHNPCDTPQSFSLNLTVLEDGSLAEEYCHRLEIQNDGDQIVRWNVFIGGMIAYIIGIYAWCMCTVCCTCCCCCARPGCCNKISTPCSRGCFKCWGNLVTRCGCGWIMGKAGGMRFYTENQSTNLLFWSFAASCMYAIVSIQFPQFVRDDTIDPQFKDTRSTWGAGADILLPDGQDIKAVHFLFALQYAVYNAVLPFMAMVLNFSDPLRDRSFRSKAGLFGFLLFMTTVLMCFSVADSWRYYELWEYKGHQVILQLGLFLTQSMTILSYIQLRYRSSKQRAAVMHAHGGKLPDLLPEVEVATDNVPNKSLPVAEVVHTDNTLKDPKPSAQNSMVSGRKSTPEVDSANVLAEGTNNPSFEPELADVGVQIQPQKRDRVTAPGPVAEALVDRKQNSYSSFDKQPNGSALPADIPESAAAAEAEKSRTGVMGFFKKQWESVCEDPATGFKYSVFVSASLLLTFITLTAAFLRMLHWVRQLADCTEEDSTCVQDVQLWFYRRLVKGLVKVDPQTFELQLSGACEVVPPLNGTLPGNVTSDWRSSNAQFAGACEAVELLKSAQDESTNPEWISNAKVPVLVGGHIGFLVAYCLGLYTIFHVARAYKKLELKLRAAKIAELLFQKRSMDLAELRSAASSSTAYTAGGTVKHKIGKNIVDDYKHVRIAQSAYFVGTLVSTCQVQLVMAGTFLMGVIGALIHPNFWQFVGQHYWWPISIVIIILWHIISQMLLNKYVTADGKRIKWPFLWLFAYVALSAAYCMVGLLIAFFRLVWLMITSIVALSRLDACLFTVMKGRDAGYASFLAMALMLHALRDCLSEHNVTKESIQKDRPLLKNSSDALASEAVSKWKRSTSSSATQRGQRGDQRGDQPTEVQMSNN